jgi:SAM-dependent methyltransferase
MEHADSDTSNIIHTYFSRAMLSPVEDDLSNWGIDFETYQSEYVTQLSSSLAILPGDSVFESACGTGWFIRALKNLLPEQSKGVRWYGNDVLPHAIAVARRDIPKGTFCLANSANLSWVPPGIFDFAVCGYLEPSRTAQLLGNGGPTELRDWCGNWVQQMCLLTKPGGWIFVGALHPALENGGDPVQEGWWVEVARLDSYGWGVDPTSVRIEELTSPILTHGAWGPRYNVYMQKATSRQKPPSLPGVAR